MPMAEPGLYGSVAAAATSGTRHRRTTALVTMVAVVTLCSISAIAYFGSRTDSLEGLPDGKHYLMNMLRDEAPLLHRRHDEMAAISTGTFAGAGLADPTIINGMADSLDQGTPDRHVKLAQSTTAYNSWIQAQRASQLMANSPIKAKTQMLLSESDYYGYGGGRHSALFDNSEYNDAMTSGLFTEDTSVQSLSQASGPSSPMAPSFMVGPGQMPAAGAQLVAKCTTTFPVQALALQPQATVTISLENAPIGASLTNVVAANPGSATFSYSPLPGGAAAPVCFLAVDSARNWNKHCVSVRADATCTSQQLVAPAPTLAQLPSFAPAPVVAAAPAPPARPQSASHRDCAPLFHYYNKDLKDHFYTSNFLELGGGKLHYDFHGVLMGMYSVQHDGMVPVFRFYNDRSHVHQYSTNEHKFKLGSQLTSSGEVQTHFSHTVFPAISHLRLPDRPYLRGGFILRVQATARWRKARLSVVQRQAGHVRVLPVLHRRRPRNSRLQAARPRGIWRLHAVRNREM